MGSPNLEGRACRAHAKPLPSRRRTQRQEARRRRSYARLDSPGRGHTWHGDAGRLALLAQAKKMKAAVFAALATTAAAFAPVARPLATAAATKLSVVPETVAELPSMLTALPTLTAPQEGELFFTSPFFVAFFVLSSALGWPVLAALRLNASNSPYILAPRLFA